MYRRPEGGRGKAGAFAPLTFLKYILN